MDSVNLAAVTKEIKAFVPDATLKHKYGVEVAYALNPKKIASFGSLFERLETKGESIGIESFGIELPGLEDVFFK